MRYADNALIFCKSRKSAERTLANIIPFIEGELFLRVNRAKTIVTHVSRIKYLGYAFYGNRGKCRFRLHPRMVRKKKDRIRGITRKNRGWINYCKLADMKGLTMETDQWLRRRIRAIYLGTMEKGEDKVPEPKSVKA